MILAIYKKWIIAFLCFISIVLEASDSIPVVFIHSGDAFYLEDTIAQAKQFNDRVILLGDDANRHNAKDGVEYYPMADFYKEADNFTKIYRHMSHIPYQFELACFTRWLVLKEFMGTNNIPLSFYVDSDVMLYCDISKEYETNFKGCDLGVAIQCGFCVGLVSYWTHKTIESFCSYLINFYKDNVCLDIFEDQFKLGGEQFHDDWPHMTNWVLENYKNFKLGNLSSLINNTTFDSSIWHDYILVDNSASITEYKRYHMRDCVLNLKSNEKLMKDIVWHKGLPYCYNPDIGSFIQFKGLHFQGGSKTFIKEYKINRENNYTEPEPYKSIAVLPLYNFGFLGSENQKCLENLVIFYKPKTVVELGSSLGLATIFIGFLMPEDGKLYAVDCFDNKIDPVSKNIRSSNNYTYSIYQQFLSNIKHHRLCDKVVPVKMSNVEAAEILDVSPDLLYIDSSTEEDLVYQDIMTWYPKVKNGGIICGNNWKWFESVEKGVRRAAKELGKAVTAHGNFWFFAELK